MKRRGFDGEYFDGEARGCQFVAGTRGYGKTTEVIRMLETGSGPGVIVDPLASHSLRGARVVSQPVELKEYLRRPRGRVLYQPMAGDMDEHFRAVCKLVSIAAKSLGGITLVVDEVDMFCGPRWGDTRMPPELYDLANYGRHRRVALLYTAREPMRVARGLTAAAIEMRLFQMNEPDYVAYFQSFIGDEARRVLPKLPKFHYLQWFKNGDASRILTAGRVTSKNLLGTPA